MAKDSAIAWTNNVFKGACWPDDIQNREYPTAGLLTAPAQAI